MKRLVGSVAVALALVLSACGGGDDDRQAEVEHALCVNTQRQLGHSTKDC